MADVLNVIADIIKQDKQQKREHAKVMREVQKKLKEKELPEKSGDKEEYQKFVDTMLKKFGVKSPAELSPDKKKEFFDALDAGWEGDNEKPEPEDEETTLGQRIKDRMEQEKDKGMKGYSGEDSEEGEEPEPEEDEDDDPVGDEPSEDQIDKIADLVVQKLKDKADEEEDEEDEPEETEAEKGEEEEINTRPKMEAVRNPHARNTWEEALRKVYFKEEKVPEPIPEVIKSVGKELRNYAMKSGGIDRDDFLKISKILMQGKMPKANMINKMDTDPREFVFDLMAKTMGWKYVEQYGGIRFQHRTDYVESFQGGHVLQEHCGECGAMDHVDEKKMFSGKGEFEVKYASSKKGPIKVSKFNTLDDAKKFLAQVKKEGMNGIISKGGKPVKEEVEIDEKKSDYEDQIKAFLAKGGKIQRGDKPNKKKIDKVTNAFLKRYGAMKKKEAELDAKDKEELEKMMGEELVTEAWIDNDARKVERKWSKMDKRAKKKWMDGIMAKAKKEGMPKDELMDVLDDYGLTMEETSNLNKLDDWGIDLRKEGYMVMPAIDRERYTPMRGMEGPFPTFSGKVLYYDPKAGMYYDRDSDIYLSYDAYLEYDKISPSQQKQMKLGPLGDPKDQKEGGKTG